MRDLPFLAQIDLRGDAGDPRFQAAVRAAIGIEVPSAANTAFGNAERSALWLGPDEWLIVGREGTERQLVDSLRGALGALHCSVADVSASRAVIEISGARAREVLMKGCALDLHPRTFALGRCAQTLFARAQIILWQTENEPPAYRLFVRSSFAAYLAEWLVIAAVEFIRSKPLSRLPGSVDP